MVSMTCDMSWSSLKNEGVWEEPVESTNGEVCAGGGEL